MLEPLLFTVFINALAKSMEFPRFFLGVSVKLVGSPEWNDLNMCRPSS